MIKWEKKMEMIIWLSNTICMDSFFMNFGIELVIKKNKDNGRFLATNILVGKDQQHLRMIHYH